MWLWKPQQVFGSILSTVWDSLAGPKYSFPSAQTGYRVVGRKRGGWGVQQPKGKPKGAPKGGKSGGKGKWETQDASPSAPQIESLPAAPSATAPPLPRKAVESSGAAPSQEKTQLDTLVSLLAEAGTNVPEPVRALVAEHQRTATQNLTRSLHRAVADQSRARAELQKLRANRSQFLEAWKGYIDQLTALLEAQLNDQEAALEKFNAAEIAISEEDQEMEDGEFRASEAAETEARLQKETEEHQSAGRNLHNALQVARQQAAEHLNKHQREGSRTPRRKNDVEPEGQQVDKAKEEATGKPSGGSATTPFKLGGSQAQAKSAPRTSAFGVPAPFFTSVSEQFPVQREHSSLSQPVCPVGSTAFPLRLDGWPLFFLLNRLEQAWLEDLCEFRDEQGRRVDAITADGTSPEWLVLSLTDPLAPVHIEAVSPDEIAVLPEDLASPAERFLCMGAVPGLRYLLRERVPLQRHYTLFERAGNLHIRPLRPEWSLLDLVQDVMSVVPMLRSIQVLHSPLDRLPVLQVAATEMGWPTDSLAIPFDLRGAGLQICTLVVGPGLTQRILHEAVWRPLADVQFFVPEYPAVWANDPAVLPYTLQSQGWALSVNGVAASCIRRSLETGDVIFLSRPNKPVPGFHFGHAVLLMPHLRVLTLPIPLVDAKPVPQQLTLAQTRDNSAIMRDELTRHINARLHLMGSAGSGLYPVTVMGMHHGPVMLYLPGPEPSLEHVQIVLDSIPEMPAGVQAFPCEAFPGETPIFVTADPEAGTATAIVASTLGFGLDNLISVPLLPTQQHLGTAVYLAPGYVAEPFVRPPNGHYIRRTRVSLPGSGTSLACLDSGLDQAKNARLCSQARANGIVSPRCLTSAQPKPLPLLSSEAQASIVTPMGRRKLPILKPDIAVARQLGPDQVQSVQDPVDDEAARDAPKDRPLAAPAPIQLDLATLPLTAAPKSRDELKRCIADLKRPWLGFWQPAWERVPALGADACAWLYHSMDFWRPHHRVHLFTDGSLLKVDGREVCGWGLVLAFEDLHTGSWTSGGFACGSLQSFLDRPVGASNTSFDAEIAACLVALLWSFCLPQGMEVFLWHDCKSAGEILCGACSPQAAPSFVSLACRLRSVAVLAQQTGVKVQPQWIPSHSGIFFNEVVDAVAKAGARGDGCSLPLPAATWKLLESPFLPWAWLTDYNGNAFPLFDRIADGVYEPSDEVPVELLPSTVEHHCLVF
ncbi:unnamed protein product [Symbiodinium microadriaticum]|nr:unnamed protein product [Symbiodinium microadriaticum]